MGSRSLERLFWEDKKSRWNIIASAALMTAAVGMGADLDGMSLEMAEIIATIVGAVFFLVCVAVYVWRN